LQKILQLNKPLEKEEGEKRRVHTSIDLGLGKPGNPYALCEESDVRQR
jgi:hypothetical protein